MKGVLSFPYEELEDFLKDGEKSEQDIIKRFNIKDHANFLTVLRIATYKMLIYEYPLKKRCMRYGLLK